MPVARRAVVGAVLLEALTVLGYGIYLAVEAFVSPSSSRVAAVFLGVTTILLGLGLGIVARAVSQGRRGARSPVLVWQALQAVIAVPAAYGSADALMPWYAGVPLVVLCLVAGLGVLRRDVVDDRSVE